MTRLATTLVLAALLASACADTGDPAAEDPLPTVLTTRGATTTTPSTVAAPTTAAVTTTVTAPETTTTTRSRSGPGPGGEVIVGDDQEPPTLNPYVPGGDNFIVAKVAQAHLTGVWDIDGATLELIPEVVVELPTVANGGVTVNDDGTMTVRYRVRDEAEWADGTPISGADIAFTYEMIHEHDVDVHNAPYDLVAPGSVVADGKTVELTLRQPTILYEGLFQWIVPRHDVAGSDFLRDWNDRAWVAGGPFVFEEWVRGSHISLVRNENYWKVDPVTGDRLPYLDRLVVRFIPETGNLHRAFAGRELQAYDPPPALDYIRMGLDLVPEGAVVVVQPSPIFEHLNFQFGENNPNPDSQNARLAYRRAVAHAIDREALIDEVYAGLIEPLGSYLDVFTPALSTRAWDRYPYDPARARDLVAAVCAELERDCQAEPLQAVFSTTGNADLRPRIAMELEEMLAEVGIDLRVDLQDSSLYFGETLDRGAWDLGLWAWVGAPGLGPAVAFLDLVDPDAPPPDGSNYYRWGTPAVSGTETRPGGMTGPGERNPDYDLDQGPSLVRDEHTARLAELRDFMAATIDHGELIALIREAEQILADQMVFLPLASRLGPAAWWGDQLGGYVPNQSQASNLWNVEHWYRVDR